MKIHNTAKNLKLKKEYNIALYSFCFLVFCMLYGSVTYSYLIYKLDYEPLKAGIIALFPFVLFLFAVPVLIDKHEEITEYNTRVKKTMIDNYIKSLKYRT